MSKKLKIVVLMGGRSPEYDVSLSSGKEVLKNLDKQKYRITPLVIPKEKRFNLNKLIKLKPDLVFPALHGPFGEDGSIQGLLEFLGIPYVSAGVLASALGMNKIMYRKILKSENIPVPRYLEFKESDDKKVIFDSFKLPVVVKPSCQGSSVGVSIVEKETNLDEALKNAFCFDKSILVEEYLDGVEITCGVLGNKDLLTLPLVEIRPKNRFFDYEAKYTPGKCDEIAPAEISSEETKDSQKIALKAYKAIGCQVFGRVDMILVRGVPYVLELNTIPGLTPASLLPKAAKAAGLSYAELLDCLIRYSLEK